MPTDPEARRFVLGVLVAFLPAMVIGAALHSFIKDYLFDTSTSICYALIAGGFVLLAVDSLELEQRYKNPYVFPLPMYSRSACSSALPWCRACRAPAPPSSAPC